MKIQLKHSNVLDSGLAKQPTAVNMLDGEIAVNFNATDPAIFIKNSDGNIVRIAGKDNLAFTGYEASIQAASSPPTGLEAGNLYFDTDDNRLYYYYNDGTTTQWVDASTEKFDVTIIPDPTNLSHQSGTLDDRYVNSNGDTMSGNLVLNAGVNINSSDIYLNNGKITFEGASANAHEIRLTVIEPTADRTLSLPDTTGTIVSTGDAGTVTSSMIADGTIQNIDVSNSAAIALSKLATGSLPSGITVASANITNGTIVDADINSSASITLSKLGSGALPSGVTITSSSIAGGVAPTDIAAGALPNNVTITTSNITNGTIIDEDVSSSAKIQVSKLADGSSRQLLQVDAAGSNVEWTSDVDIPGTLDVAGNSTFDGNATVSGNLIVDGSTVALNANIVTVKDTNIQLGVISSPTDVSADGGGITLKGTTDKTFNWLNSSDSWTSSENLDLASGKAYYINGAEVLNQTSLASGVTGSSLTSLGTINSGTWQGNQITDAYLATISTAGKVANTATTATNLNSANAIVARDGSGDFIARNITASLIGNADSADKLSTARTISLTGDLTGSASFDGTSNISINTSAIFTGTTNLSYITGTRTITSDTGTNAILPLFSNTDAGLTGASGGGTVNYLRADGTWASPPGTATNLGYVLGTSTITSSTGTGVALPLFSSSNSGLVQGSGGGTTKFLRADGSWIDLGSSSTSLGTNPPTNPAPGDSWFDTDEGRTYIYYQDTDSSQWVEANPSWNGGIPVGSVTPNYLSIGGPNWDASGNLTASGSITAASGVITGKLGIGNTDPDQILTVGNTTTNNIIRMRAGATSVNGLDFGDANDPDIGRIRYAHSDDSMAFTTNASERMRIDSSGRLGIGTTSPNNLIHVSGNSNPQISVYAPNIGTNSAGFFIGNEGQRNWQVWADRSTDQFRIGNNSRANANLVIKGSTGDVGIGTDSPVGTLDIISASGRYLFRSDQGSICLDSVTQANSAFDDLRIRASNILFQEGGTERMRVAAGGNVGIGTSSPSSFAGDCTLAISSTGGARIGLNATGRNYYIGGDSGSDRLEIGRRISSNSADSADLVLTATGKVGIGTTSPAEKLQVDGTILAEVINYGPNQDQPYLIAGTTNYTGATTNFGTYGIQHRFKVNSGGTGRVTIDTSNGEAFCVNNTGKVGIGTSSPTDNLTIASGSNQIGLSTGNQSLDGTLDLGHFGNGAFIGTVAGTNAAANVLRLGVSGIEKMRIGSDGNVGIGLSSPTAPLHVGTATTAGYSISINRNGAARYHLYNQGGIAEWVLGQNASNDHNFKITKKVGATEFNYLTILASGGNVGIGTDSPNRKLVIAGSGGASNVELRLNASDGGARQITFAGTGSTTHGIRSTGTSGNSLTFTSGSSEYLRIDSSGNVGIGTSSPGKALHLSNSNPQMRFTDTGTGANFDINANSSAGNVALNVDAAAASSQSSFIINTRNSERFRIVGTSGNVGIGTSAPGYKLTVNGTCAASNLYINDDRKLALNVNDGHGNTNICFNDISGVGQRNGSCARITSTTDSTAANFQIQVGNNSVAGSTNSRTTILTLTTSGASINGSLSKSSGSFKIDHPLPELSETHDLVHSFVEAPDASNLYAGMVDLVDGTATVNIDTAHRMTEGTFEALNTLQSWSSSNESGYSPVKCSVSGNLLTIECQDATSTDTVYYEVRGVRKDPHMLAAEWTDSNGLVIVEPEKIVTPEA